MKEEKHQEILKEVLEEIETAVKDSRGLAAHQRRLAFVISLGATTLLELYFHQLKIIKEGAKINHLWLRKKKETIKESLQKQIISPIDMIENIEAILDLAISLEEKRDDLAYGAIAEEKILKEKVNLFFQLKVMVKC